MPTRRTMALIIAVTIAAHPVFAMAKLWATRTLGTSAPGSVTHGAAEVAAVVF